MTPDSISIRRPFVDLDPTGGAALLDESLAAAGTLATWGGVLVVVPPVARRCSTVSGPAAG